MALQLCKRPDDVSVVHVQPYVTRPERRAQIVKSLHLERCVDFLHKLEDMTKGLEDHINIDVAALVLSIAQLIDKQVFVERAHEKIIFGKEDLPNLRSA
ncbi:hypothetical protein IFT43_10155 [Oxalobacteraceae sp. CFBP 13708]|nr:hypothetical protein [Oxalobacteraceae sp. CFBP 13708]